LAPVVTIMRGTIIHLYELQLCREAIKFFKTKITVVNCIVSRNIKDPVNCLHASSYLEVTLVIIKSPLKRLNTMIKSFCQSVMIGSRKVVAEFPFLVFTFSYNGAKILPKSSTL